MKYYKITVYYISPSSFNPEINKSITVYKIAYDFSSAVEAAQCDDSLPDVLYWNEVTVVRESRNEA